MLQDEFPSDIVRNSCRGSAFVFKDGSMEALRRKLTMIEKMMNSNICDCWIYIYDQFVHVSTLYDVTFASQNGGYSPMVNTVVKGTGDEREGLLAT